MSVQTPPRPTTRIPLGELPLADFVLRNSSGANVSPILKPAVAKRSSAASTPRRIKQQGNPATPPHSTTKPVNIRPHHPHVYHGARNDSASPSIHGHPQRPCTPTMDACLTASPSTQRRSADVGRNRSDSASSSMSNQGPAPLARKRDRVNPTEVAQARERVHRPITGSPSPRKPVESPSHAHHRRNSSTASLTGFMASRTRTGSISESGGSSSRMLGDDDENCISDDDETHANDVQVSPMKLVPSPKPRSHRSSLSGSGRPFFNASLDDIFGVNTCTSDGSLVIHQDIIEEEPSPTLPDVKRRRVSQDDMTVDKENLAVTSGSRSSSGSLSPFFRGSSSPEEVQPHPQPKRKGTGGRLSLLASALDSDADSSRESVR